MKQLFLIFLFAVGCQSNAFHVRQKPTDTLPHLRKSNSIKTYSPDVDSITKDFSSFWDYWNSYLNFSEQYIPYDEKANKISKSEFFQKLLTARFLPVLIKEDDSNQYIQLKKIKKITNSEINSIIKQESTIYYQFYKMEGKQLPMFNFKDLEGNVYNNDNCTGKILVLNAWFVTCKACIAEIPDLNQLADSYKDRKDVLFLGLCLDPSDKVKKFLTKVQFKYHLIPDAKVFDENALELSGYPTNIIVNKNGYIVKAGIGASDLKKELDKMIN